MKNNIIILILAIISISSAYSMCLSDPQTSMLNQLAQNSNVSSTELINTFESICVNISNIQLNNSNINSQLTTINSSVDSKINDKFNNYTTLIQGLFLSAGFNETKANSFMNDYMSNYTAWWENKTQLMTILNSINIILNNSYEPEQMKQTILSDITSKITSSEQAYRSEIIEIRSMLNGSLPNSYLNELKNQDSKKEFIDINTTFACAVISLILIGGYHIIISNSSYKEKSYPQQSVTPEQINLKKIIENNLNSKVDNAIKSNKPIYKKTISKNNNEITKEIPVENKMEKSNGIMPQKDKKVINKKSNPYDNLDKALDEAEL